MDEREPLLSDVNDEAPIIPYRKVLRLNRVMRIILIFALILLTALFSMHQIVVPHRIQLALNDPSGIEIDTISVLLLNSTGATFSVDGRVLIKQNSPLSAVFEETSISIVSIRNQSNNAYRRRVPLTSSLLSYFGLGLPDWTESDRFYAKVDTLGFIIVPQKVSPAGASELSLKFTTQFSSINVEVIRDIIADFLQRNQTNSLLRLQSQPVIRIPGFATYMIPMWSFFNFDTLLSNTKTHPPNHLEIHPSPFNVSITDKHYGIRFDPFTFKQYYTVDLDTEWISALPITVVLQSFSISLSVYYESKRIVDITIPRSTLRLVKGVNAKRLVHLATNPDNSDSLMQFISRYSEGEQLTVVLKDAKINYLAGMSTVAWLDDMLNGLEVALTLPPGADVSFMKL